jgi:hypothetical protein
MAGPLWAWTPPSAAQLEQFLPAPPAGWQQYGDDSVDTSNGISVVRSFMGLNSPTYVELTASPAAPPAVPEGCTWTTVNSTTVQNYPAQERYETCNSGSNSGFSMQEIQVEVHKDNVYSATASVFIPDVTYQPSLSLQMQPLLDAIDLAGFDKATQQ